MDVESRPLKGIVADEIRSRIIVGTLNLGERVSDKDLASELRISRTPVREALLQLQAEGLSSRPAPSGWAPRISRIAWSTHWRRAWRRLRWRSRPAISPVARRSTPRSTRR
jgi:hypothetical protein